MQDARSSSCHLMLFQPGGVDALHLRDMVGDVALIDVEPVVEGHGAVFGMIDGAGPGRVGQGPNEGIGVAA